MTKPISFRVLDGTDLDDWLASRRKVMAGSARSNGEQARAELEMWRAAQRAELARHRFSLREISCVADVLNGTMLDAAVSIGGPGMVAGDVMIAFARAIGPSSYGTKWKIDEKALLGKLSQLGPVADHALRYAVTHWWEDAAEATMNGFRKYGINVIEEEV